MFDAEQKRGESDDAFDERIKAAIAALEHDASGAVILPLEYPITVRIKGGGETREEERASIRLRRPTGADLRALDVRKPETRIILDRIERLSGLTQLEVDKLDEADIKRAGLVVGNFS